MIRSALLLAFSSAVVNFLILMPQFQALKGIDNVPET